MGVHAYMHLGGVQGGIYPPTPPPMKRLEPPFKGKSKLITIKYTIHDPKLFLIPILNFFSIPYNDPAPEPQLGQGRAERLRE
jgi:hypothetical protein